MDKPKRWQLFLIIAVLALTIYNILPTVFYYAQPLKEPVNAVQAEHVATGMISRVNALETESKAWLQSFCKLLGIKPSSVKLQKNDPRIIEIAFKDSHDADLFKRFLPTAGSMISFVPSQLELAPGASKSPDTVLVSRQIGVHLTADDSSTLFKFSPKYDEQGTVTAQYQEIAFDRATQLALAFGGPSKQAQQLIIATQADQGNQYDDLIVGLAKEIVDVDKSLDTNSPIAKRFYASFTQTDQANRSSLISKFVTRARAIKTRLETQKLTLGSGGELDTEQGQQLSLLESQIKALKGALKVVQAQKADFEAGKKPLTANEVLAQLKEGAKKIDAKDPSQVLALSNHNPFIEKLVLDWTNDTIEIRFFNDVQSIRDQAKTTETTAFVKDKMNQFVVNEIARASRISDEEIAQTQEGFAINLDTLTNPTGFLALDLGQLAKKQTEQLTNQLVSTWTPQHPDLLGTVYPIMGYDKYNSLSPEEQKLALVVYAPAMYESSPPAGFRNDSIYVIARGLDSVIQKYRENPEAPESKALLNDVEQLSSILQKNGFMGYPGSTLGVDAKFKKDFIFEQNDYASPLLSATREDFNVKGSKRLAVLDFTDLEQRIIATNNIEDSTQESLLQWYDEYNTAQVSLDPTRKYLVPAPTKNAYWENLKLGTRKYFRGDDSKILTWGLDLSGGKTVRIGLRDHNNRPVTNPEDLNQAVNELYKRVNKMGVAERTIRVENENIILDFPGSQALSAADLVKASAMYFHIVNEKFSQANPVLKEAVNSFLQDVWNEASVTNRKDLESINQIAWEHLGGDLSDGVEGRPRSENAQLLYDNGLRLGTPSEKGPSHTFNDSLSKIAMLRGDDFSAWEGQSHPLVVTFYNYALEGSSLSDVSVRYEPTKGNTLAFSIAGSYKGRDTGNPREDLYNWTSQFSEDRIQGTPKEAYSQGRGWRMAAILNDRIITQPSLQYPIRQNGEITGRFTQREINQLAADLKAGSLSFTPRILSEHNISPELGLEERGRGIKASLIALALVVVAMVGYYRFAGIVASCAVLLNIFIIWGVLQNLGAAITLPGIAAIVLTIGMAVDANVLVFERIREEFKISGRIASAIQAGYRKAFSAIIDSNITTIIAALILIQFDSGPIKGFAITLIIGIVSSMFTALFLTRYFFANWVRNPKNKELKMAEMVGDTKFNFLGWARTALISSAIIMIAGSYLFVEQRNTLFGMDFTGGYSLTAELDEQPNNPSYRLEAASALLAKGATSNDFIVRELSRPNQLRIQLGIGMEEKDHPFYQMPETLTEGTFAYDYQKNPRIVWVVNALESAGLKVQQSELESLEKNWSVMSGQFSSTMRNNALMALGFALLSILIYITIRFEFKYAIGAVIALAHDVIITLGVLSLFHALGFHVQIDLEIIGAIMTIIGYSLNDTIIIFDRIREDLHLQRKMSFSEVINHALNVTLSRTLMTSGTTLLVLLALVLLGGPAIFGFSLVMTIGVVVGTLSSLFVAGPVLLYFHNREAKHPKTAYSKG